MMRGLMMDRPLLISSILEHAALQSGDIAMVSHTGDLGVHRTSYAELARRARRLANALRDIFDIGIGDRIGTLAWNDHRHFELYYGIAGIGAICHTINPRLFPEQIAYIINHAQDGYLFVDPTFLPLVERLAPQLPTVRGVVVLSDAAHLPASGLPHLYAYEALLEGQPDRFDWPMLDETTASGLCYTSGTTGNPRGALYHHRSTILHGLSQALPNSLGLAADDIALPAVPMFHANAWGLPHACPLVGAGMVMPGPRLDGASLYEQLERERVTFSAGVPTVWFALLHHLEATGKRLSTVRRVVIGGSAVPRAMIDKFEAQGVEVRHGWGMTEMSPVGAICSFDARAAALPTEERRRLQLKQGRPPWGVEMRIIDDEGSPLPRDGASAGLLLVRGPWIASAYFRDDDATVDAFCDGWFATGDVATIDRHGYMEITDRAKDVIKSGGEWISSIVLENTAVGHPDLQEAAVIAVPHPRWGERPLLIAVARPDAAVTGADVLAFLQDKVARWWLPDDVVFVAELPHTATGKLQKSRLREMFKDHALPTA
ncbi:MAG TPA: long-chain-fatty-acid--CoA ligase [Geminicoccaceae bacterium]|nr:long-chain-fatty-acid--CoA ligase [Geminicoccaceae bacterium]